MIHMIQYEQKPLRSMINCMRSMFLQPFVDLRPWVYPLNLRSLHLFRGDLEQHRALLHGAHVRRLDLAAPQRDAAAEQSLYGHRATQYGAGDGLRSLSNASKTP